MVPTVRHEISTSDVLHLEPLPEGPRSRVTVDSILRRLPGARLTIKANAPSGAILLKIFRGKSARSRAEDEAKAARRLADAGVRAPKVIGIFRVTTDDTSPETMFACALEWIGDGIALDRALTAASPAERSMIASVAADGFSKIERAHLVHGDPHPRNFLWTGEALAWLDAGAVTKKLFTPSKKSRIEHRVAFLAALPPDFDREISSALFEQIDGAPLFAGFDVESAVLRRRAELLRAFARKMLRTNSRARVEKTADAVVFCVADGAVAEFFDRPFPWSRPIESAVARRELPQNLVKIDVFPFDGRIEKAVSDDLLKAWQMGLFLDSRGITAPRIDAIIAQRTESTLVELIVVMRPVPSGTAEIASDTFQAFGRLLRAYGISSRGSFADFGTLDGRPVVRTLDGLNFA
jgi:hypothetical protein